jgi:hypothetical protein
MLYEILKAKLPMIIYCLGIATAVILVRTRQIQPSQIIELTLALLGTLGVLKTYAPKVFETASQGIGMHTGLNMVGGSDRKS